MIDLSLDVEQYDCPFIDTTVDHGVEMATVQWDFDRARRELETRLAVEAESRGELDAGLSALREHANTTDYSLVSRQGEVAHVRTRIVETDAMAAVRANDGYITGPFYVAEGSEVWHVGFDRSRQADDALAELERDNEFAVVERTDTSMPDLQEFVQNAGAAMTLIEGCRDLSDVERETLERAVDSGYFETPRDASLGTLAEEFGVSKPAVSKNLRRGQQKMIERVVDALQDLD